MLRRCAVPAILAAAVGCHQPCRLRDPGPPPAAPPPAGVVQAAARETAPTAAPVRPKNVLVMSGGGSYGAYTAGVICGWSRAGTRPEFDVVTGVSTGALIAPMAFLGADTDPDLQKFYTQVRAKDVFTYRNFATVPFRESAATTAPLRKILETTMTADRFARLAAEHRKGRRLYVGTTNLETRRFVVWDIGGIANRGGPEARERIIDVLLASCAVPAVFPPVPLPSPIDGELEPHVDGGVSAPIFLPSDVLDRAKPTLDDRAPTNVYAIVAGKLVAEPSTVKPRVLKVIGASVGAHVQGHTRAELANIYHQAKAAGAEFHLTAVRQDYPITDTGIEFDPETMGRLFAEGLEVGKGGGAGWSSAPPERSPGDAIRLK